MSVIANVAINVDSRGAVAKLREVQGQAHQTERAFDALQSAIGALGVGFALTKVIADVKELDTNLRQLSTVGGNVSELNKGLGEIGNRLGGVANKAELAAASYQALSAGFTETGANLRLVEAATKAAVGGLVDVTSVVNVTTKTLNAYGMSGDQAVKVTDSISKAIEFGQVQWTDYTTQLGRVASIAAIAGVSLDEVNAFVAAATKNGATAEVAFTGLGSTLSTILQPTAESAKAAQALGINWTLAGIRSEGFESLIGKLAKAMQQNTVLAIQMVGGQEAVRGAFAAAAKGGEDYTAILKGLGGAAGKTDADFQTMKGSLENTLKALDTSFKNLSEALGTAFGPTVVIAVQDITKAVNGFADFMAEVPQPVMNTTGELVKLVAQMLLLQKAIQAIIALRVAFIGAMVGMTGATVASGAAATTSASAFALYTNNTRALQAQAAAATPVLNGLLGTLGRLAAIGAIAIVVNVAVTGMAAVLQAQAEINKLRGVRNSGGATAAFGGSATAEQKKTQQETLAAIKKERQSPEYQMMQAGAAAGVGKTMARQRADQLTERERSARAVLALPLRGTATPTVPTIPAIPVGGGDAAGGKKKGKTDAEREAERAAKEAARESQRVADVVRDQQFITKQKGIQTKFAQLIFEAEQSADPIRVRQLQTVEALVLAGNETARLLEEEKDSVAQLAIARTRQGEAEAIRQEGLQGVLKLQIEQQKSFDEIIANLDLELALKTATTEQAREQLRLAYELAKLQGQGFTPEQIGAITAKKTELARPKTDRERLQGAAAGVKAELDALTDPINAITTAAAGIGDAFSTSFKGVISGSMTAKEALASFFTSVADMFLDMAAQIIAKMIQMAILNTIVSLLPGGAGLSSGFNAGTASAIPTNAGGWAQSFATKLPGRANGGPVSSGQTYMVGERGPELFVPGRSGTIVANDKMGGGSTNVVVNVDAKGSSVEGDDQNANQLGRVISAAVQSELIKQQRPGGILAR